MPHSPFIRRAQFSTLAAAALAALAGPASAADRFWGYAAGCGAADFTSTSCWRLGAPGQPGGGTVGSPPGAGDKVYLWHSGATDLTVQLANAASPMLPVYTYLKLGGNGGGSAGLSIARNKLEVSLEAIVGDNGGNGHISQTGGTSNINYLTLGGFLGGSGEYTLSGGTLGTHRTFIHKGTFSQTGGTVRVGNGGSVAIYAGGRYFLDGGTMDMTNGSLGGIGPLNRLGSLDIGGGQLLIDPIQNEIRLGTLNFIGGDGDMLRNAKVRVGEFSVRNDYDLGGLRFVNLSADLRANALNIGLTGGSVTTTFHGGDFYDGERVVGNMTVTGAAGMQATAVLSAGTILTVNTLRVGLGESSAAGSARVLADQGSYLRVNGTANVGRKDTNSRFNTLGANTGGDIAVFGPLNVYSSAYAFGANATLFANDTTVVGGGKTAASLSAVSGGEFRGRDVNVRKGSSAYLQDGGQMRSMDPGNIFRNQGTVQFAGSGGTMDYKFNNDAGKVAVFAGATARFEQDFYGGGDVDIQPGGVAHFAGKVVRSGVAGFTGGGRSEYAGSVLLNLHSGNVLDAGDFTLLNGATTLVAFDPAGGRLRVGGALSFAGTLALSIWEGVTPQAGDSYTVFKWGSTIGSFSSFDYSQASLAPGLAWDMSSLYTKGTIKVGSVTALVPTLAPVPEPGSLVLLLAGMGAVGCAVRRRRA